MQDRFKFLLKDPRKALEEDRKIFDEFIPYALSVIDSDPGAGKPLAHVIIKHAPTACQRVQGWGLWAQIHRALGELDEAERAIENALFLADGDCRSCLADLYRRRAILRRNQRRWSTALEEVDEAVRRYIDLDHPGHDIDGNGLASCYNIRGGIRFFMDDFDGAAADYGKALALLDPKTSPVLYRIVIYNFAAALQATGRHSDLLEAAHYLNKARCLFKGISKQSQERAKLDWLTAQVRYKLEEGRPYVLRHMMERARADFVALGFELEAVTVASDLMKMKLAKSRWGQEPARDLCRDVVGELLKLTNLPGDVVNVLHDVDAAVEDCGWHAKDKLKASVDQLRKACGPNMMACLLAWETA